MRLCTTVVPHCHMVQFATPESTYLSRIVFFLHSEFCSLNPCCLKEEGSFKVPARLQPDADIWDIRVEWIRIRDKSSTLPLKGHPLTSKGSSEHCNCCLGGKNWKRRATWKRNYLKEDQVAHKKPFFMPDPGP